MPLQDLALVAAREAEVRLVDVVRRQVDEEAKELPPQATISTRISIASWRAERRRVVTLIWLSGASTRAKNVLSECHVKNSDQLSRYGLHFTSRLHP